MRDLHNNVAVRTAIIPVAIGTTGTGQTGLVIDRQGYESVEFVIQYGAITTATGVFTVTVKEGDVTGTLTSVADAGLLGTEADAGVAAAARVDYSTEKVTEKIGYIGNKRYVQCNVKSTGTAAALISAVAVLSNPSVAPVA